MGLRANVDLPEFSTIWLATTYGELKTPGSTACSLLTSTKSYGALIWPTMGDATLTVLDLVGYALTDRIPRRKMTSLFFSCSLVVTYSSLEIMWVSQRWRYLMNV